MQAGCPAAAPAAHEPACFIVRCSMHSRQGDTTHVTGCMHFMHIVQVCGTMRARKTSKHQAVHVGSSRLRSHNGSNSTSCNASCDSLSVLPQWPCRGTHFPCTMCNHSRHAWVEYPVPSWVPCHITQHGSTSSCPTCSRCPHCCC